MEPGDALEHYRAIAARVWSPGDFVSLRDALDLPDDVVRFLEIDGLPRCVEVGGGPVTHLADGRMPDAGSVLGPDARLEFHHVLGQWPDGAAIVVTPAGTVWRCQRDGSEVRWLYVDEAVVQYAAMLAVYAGVVRAGGPGADQAARLVELGRRVDASAFDRGDTLWTRARDALSAR